jgi:hypothetical protein
MVSIYDFFWTDGESLCFPEFLLEEESYPVYKENRAWKPYNSGRSTAQQVEQRAPDDSGPHTIQLDTPVGWIGTSTRTTQLNNSSVRLGHRHDQLK